MKNRELGIVLGILFAVIYSSASVSIAWVKESTKMDALWLLAIIFLSATFGALGFGFLRTKSKNAKDLPSRGSWPYFVVLGIAGILATSYFFVIFGLGPAIADWAEKALNPIILAFLAVFVLKERLSLKSIVSASVALVGYIAFMIGAGESIPSNSVFMKFMFLTFLGALGSSISVIAMTILDKKQGVSRFYSMAGRYGIVAIIMLLLAIFKGAHSTLSATNVLVCVFIGMFLINAIMYLALSILEHSGSITLGIFFLFAPILTSLWSMAFNLEKVPFNMTFLLGAAMVILGSCITIYNEYRAKNEAEPIDTQQQMEN